MSQAAAASLKTLLQVMDVPPARLALSSADIHWLGRNLALRNAAHPDLDRARELLRVSGANLVM